RVLFRSARQMPWTMAAFAIASLSIVGIPLTSGFVSKWYLVIGTVDHSNWLVMGVLLVGSLLSAAYLGPVIYKAYFEKGPEIDEEVREVPWMVAPLVITAAASLILGLCPVPVQGLARIICNSLSLDGGPLP
ncbi:MAG: proton-conducting transporter membrane subunit, partial [Pirellulales bacterium]